MLPSFGKGIYRELGRLLPRVGTSMDTDNRLRQRAAWLLHDAPDVEPEDSLAWLIAQPADTYFRRVFFRAVNLPCYGKDQWFLIGWREKTPTYPRLIEPLNQAELEPETVERLTLGEVLSVNFRD